MEAGRGKGGFKMMTSRNEKDFCMSIACVTECFFSFKEDLCGRALVYSFTFSPLLRRSFARFCHPKLPQECKLCKRRHPHILSFFFMVRKPIDLLRDKALHSVKKRLHSLGQTDMSPCDSSFPRV